VTFTANQPLMLGGQIYMWNRYHQVSKVVHMPQAQFTKFGHQSRIQFCDKFGTPQWFIADLTDRNFKALDEIFLADPYRTLTKLSKTLLTAYGSLTDPSVRDGLLETFDQYKKYSLGGLNIAMTEYLFGVIFPGQDKGTIAKNERPVSASEWVAEMGIAINCKTYLGGGTAQVAYLKESDFTSRGMSLTIQDYKMGPYPLARGNRQTNSSISIIDPLLRLGVDQTRYLISKNGGATL
jgi:hypothetical protein